MKKVVLLLLIFVLASCNSKENSIDYHGAWLRVKKTNADYVLVDCGYDGESIIATAQTIMHKGVMEDADTKIDHTKQDGDTVILFIDKAETSYYKFSWTDKDNGIAQWEVKEPDAPVTTNYFVNQTKSDKIKVVKGGKGDCVTNDDVGDVVNDTFKIGDGNATLYVEDTDCISVRNTKDETLVARCFENSIVRVRKVKGDHLPLTIINGDKSVDIDFLRNGNDWISKSATYYDGSNKSTKPIEISIKDFDFGTIIEKFSGATTEATSASSIESLKDRQKLKDLDIYAVAKILAATPISNDNVTAYNDAAYYLIENEQFNEARIILLEVVKFAPDRTVAYLNLGDAEWGFDDKENAMASYKKYISMMTTQGGKAKIPQRAYDRSK
jgi:hypothetical protein